MRALVIGGAGYVGGELLRLLHAHPAITDVRAVSRSHAGEPIGSVHPGLRSVTRDVFRETDPVDAARSSDVVFLALEHGASSRLAAPLLDGSSALLIDLAADFRIRDRTRYEAYYGTHPDPEVVGRFVYGLADVEGTRLHGVRAIAVPGCFATAAQLALFPFRSLSGLSDLTLFAITGSSGAGRELKATTHHATRAHNLFAYSLLQHRHEGEILEQWERWRENRTPEPRLLTHAGPFVRGIYLTLHARTAGTDHSASGAVQASFERDYGAARFVSLLNAPPELTHVLGTNDAAIHVTETAGEAVVTIAIDNLIKGAAGQAVQAMNLALGLSESAGLELAAAHPL